MNIQAPSPEPRPGLDYIGVHVGGLMADDKGRIFLACNTNALWEIPTIDVTYGEDIHQTLISYFLNQFGIHIAIHHNLPVFGEYYLPRQGVTPAQHWVSLLCACNIASSETSSSPSWGWFSPEDMATLGLDHISLQTQDSLRMLHEGFPHQALDSETF